MRGGEGFANSIGNGLDKLADGLGKFLEKRREEGKLEVANGKAALATLKASPSLQKSLNITPEDAERMSHAERSAAVFGGLAGMKQEEGFRAGQAQTAKILADALTQKHEAAAAQGVGDWITAAGREQRPPKLMFPDAPGGLEFGNVTMPAHEANVPVTNERLLATAPNNKNAFLGDEGRRILIEAMREKARMDGAGGKAAMFSPEQMGVPRPVPGQPGKYFVPTTSGSGQIIEDSTQESSKDYTSSDFKFGSDGNPTHWRVGDSFVKWNPKMQLVPGSKRGTVRVIPPPSNPFAAMFGGQPAADVPEATPMTPTNAPTAAPLEDFKAWLQKKKTK